MFPLSIHGEIKTADGSRQQIDAAIDRLVAAFAEAGAKPARRDGDRLTFHGRMFGSTSSVLVFFDSCVVAFEPNQVIYEAAWGKHCALVVALVLLTCLLWPILSPDVVYIVLHPLFFIVMSCVLVAACYVGARKRISSFLQQALQPAGHPLTVGHGDRTVGE